VLFDGTLMNFPVRQNRAGTNEPSAQFTFFPCNNADLKVTYGHLSGLAPSRDSGFVQQGWTDNVAPVLWSSWIGYNGTNTLAIMRSEVFAHVPGGQAIETGTEPLFAWVRLSVANDCPPLAEPETMGFAIKINSGFVSEDMRKRYNINYDLKRSKYPRGLHTEHEAYDPEHGFIVLEDGGKVRLAVPPGQSCRVSLKPGVPTERDTTIVVLMSGKKGTHADLLIPFLPADAEVVEHELALGYEKALAEANQFWAKVPSTAATFEVPEAMITQAIRRNLQTQEMLGERDPFTGHYSMLTGGWVYSHGLWPTPTSMSWCMLMDTMGYHSVVEKYLELFKKEQGTVVPPGGCYTLHPGYLSSPKSLTTIDWLTDHGAILHTISNHALLTGDRKFISEWMPIIEKACDWIKYARRLENHNGVKGVLPPAVNNDFFGPEQAVWSDGWTYKGLTSAVKLMKQIDHPRAAEFEAEAEDYRTAFRKLLFEKFKTQKRWRDEQGVEHALVPQLLSGQDNYAWEGYLDCGPLTLVYMGLADANEPIMRDALAWFRHGPVTKFHRWDSDFTQPAILDHEMSTFEPCYSWNIFHSWQTGDRQHFLEGLYSLFAGAYSRQTFSVTEMRGGVSGTVHWLPSVYLARLAVIDDQIEPDELHLLRLCPLAWVAKDKETVLERIPTVYGPVDLRFQLSNDEKTLKVTFNEKWRVPPKQVILHAPPLKGLKDIVVNGKNYPAAERIQL
jgi:hypothetical protein